MLARARRPACNSCDARADLRIKLCSYAGQAKLNALLGARLSPRGASLSNPAHQRSRHSGNCVPLRARHQDGTGQDAASSGLSIHTSSSWSGDWPDKSRSLSRRLKTQLNVCSTNLLVQYENDALGLLQHHLSPLDTPRRVPGCRRSASLRVWKAVPPTLSVTQPRCCWWPPFSSSARQLIEGTVSPPGPVSRRL